MAGVQAQTTVTQVRADLGARVGLAAPPKEQTVRTVRTGTQALPGRCLVIPTRSRSQRHPTVPMATGLPSLVSSATDTLEEQSARRAAGQARSVHPRRCAVGALPAQAGGA